MKKAIGWTLLAVFVVLFGGTSCSTGQASDERKTKEIMTEMRSQVGLPNITNFTEAKFARQISELRDQSIRTWTYYVDMNGGRHLLCESIGYPMPYSVQLTNPMERDVMNDLTIPQPEPNGLFMPESAEASWVMCSDGKGAVAPILAEVRLIGSPFPLGHVDATLGSGFDEEVGIQRLEGAEIQQ